MHPRTSSLKTGLLCGKLLCLSPWQSAGKRFLNLVNATVSKRGYRPQIGPISQMTHQEATVPAAFVTAL